MKELFQCTDTIARIRVSPLVARTKKPCRFSHGRTLGKTTINPSTFPAARFVARRFGLPPTRAHVVAELAGYPMEAGNA
jgi:hypothetical protein